MPSHGRTPKSGALHRSPPAALLRHLCLLRSPKLDHNRGKNVAIVMKHDVAIVMIRCRRQQALLLFLLAVLSPFLVMAQQALGTLSGTVLDSNGAATPGAWVTLTESDSGLARTKRTDALGHFRF